MVSVGVCPGRDGSSGGLGDLAYHLPFMVGQQSSRDEQGACAVLAVHLNTLLGERPVQHREVQGNESDLFMSYFPRGLKYRVSPTCNPSPPCFPSEPPHLSDQLWSGGRPGYTWGLVFTFSHLPECDERQGAPGLPVRPLRLVVWAAGRWRGVSFSQDNLGGCPSSHQEALPG